MLTDHADRPYLGDHESAEDRTMLALQYLMALVAIAAALLLGLVY